MGELVEVDAPVTLEEPAEGSIMVLDLCQSGFVDDRSEGVVIGFFKGFCYEF